MDKTVEFLMLLQAFGEAAYRQGKGLSRMDDTTKAMQAVVDHYAEATQPMAVKAPETAQDEGTPADDYKPMRLPNDRLQALKNALYDFRGNVFAGAVRIERGEYSAEHEKKADEAYERIIELFFPTLPHEDDFLSIINDLAIAAHTQGMIVSMYNKAEGVEKENLETAYADLEDQRRQAMDKLNLLLQKFLEDARGPQALIPRYPKTALAFALGELSSAAKSWGQASTPEQKQRMQERIDAEKQRVLAYLDAATRGPSLDERAEFKDLLDRLEHLGYDRGYSNAKYNLGHSTLSENIRTIGAVEQRVNELKNDLLTRYQGTTKG
jgi:hypothetical protein